MEGGESGNGGTFRALFLAMSRGQGLIFVVVSSLSVGVVAAPSVRSETPVVAEPQRFDQPFHLEARLGGGTSVGLIGVVGEWNVVDVLALGVGVGFNEWPVFGAGARVRWPVGTFAKHQHAFTLEVDYSRGKYAGMPSFGSVCLHSESCDVRLDPATAHWIQSEVGWELRTLSGFTLRLAVGAAWLLNSIDWRCTKDDQPTPCQGKQGETSIPVSTVALGYAF